jgi:hypothetical protein
MRALPTIVLVIAAAPALAQSTAGPTVHPLYAELPGSTRNAEAKRLFSETVARYRLGPVEGMDIPGPPAPRAPELLKVAAMASEKRKFDEATQALEPAIAEVMASGGDGMSPGALSDLFLFQGITAQKAGWNELEAPLTEIAPPRAREAYLRAAVLAPDRVLERRRYQPLAIASFQLAAAEVKQRPRGNLLVRARPNASITIDGGAVQPPPASASNLPYGEHFVRVEEVGYQPWSAVVTLSMPTLEMDVPGTAPLMPDDREAARQARRQGAAFALLSMLKLGPPPTLELHLIDASNGQLRDATVVPFEGEAGALDAAVMRLDAEARRIVLGVQPEAVKVPSTDLTVAPVPTDRAPEGPPLRDDPGAWARRHWPLLTAIGATVGAALVLGIAVASDSH